MEDLIQAIKENSEELITYSTRFQQVGLCPQCKSKNYDESFNWYKDDDTLASIDIYCKDCGYSQHTSVLMCPDISLD